MHAYPDDLSRSEYVCVAPPLPPPTPHQRLLSNCTRWCVASIKCSVCVHRLIATLQIMRSTPQRAASFDRASEWFRMPSEMNSSKWPTFFARARAKHRLQHAKEFARFERNFSHLGTDKFARTERIFSPPASEMSAPTCEKFRSVERNFSHAGPPNIGPKAAKNFAPTERIFSPTASEMLAATGENFR